MSAGFVPLRRERTQGGNITQVREKFKKAEDVRLITHFAEWLSGVTDSEIHDVSLPEDLLDGIALCKLMMQIEGTGVTKYHALRRGSSKMDAFKSRENCARFTQGCKNIGLPVTFGYDDLASGDLGVIASTLVYLAHACALRNVGVQEMGPELKQRLGLVAKEKQDEGEDGGVDRDEILEQFDALREFLPQVKPDSELEKMTLHELLVELERIERARVDAVKALRTSGANPAQLKQLENLALDETLARAVRDAVQVDLALVGVDFRYLQGMFPAEQVAGLSVTEVGSKFIAPLLLSKKQNADLSLAAILLQERNANVSPCADVVLCLDGAMQWSTMLSALEETVEATDFVSASGKTTVWLEQMCMPPAATLSASSVEKEQTMKHVIDKVGRVNLILHPFDKPTVALQSYSVYQVACAVANKKPVFASIAQSEAQRFVEDVVRGNVGLKNFQQMLWGLNVEHCKNAADPDQVARTVQLVRKVDATLRQTRVNDAFTVPIRNWLLHQLKTAVVEDGSKRSNLLMSRAAFHQCIGQPDEARNYYEKVITVHQDLFDSEKNAQTASAMSNLATSMRDLADFENAELVCRKALSIREELFGEDHPTVMVSRAWLGDILLAAGAYEKALPILERVLQDHERLGSDDMEISSAMNNLASAFRELGQTEQARNLFEQVLKRAERSAPGGKESPLYLAALTNCALTMEALKDYQNARVMHEESLALKIKSLGGDHPDVALSMHNLGVCLLRIDKRANREQAVEYGNRAIAIWEKAFGPKHPTVIEAKQDWESFNKPAKAKASS